MNLVRRRICVVTGTRAEYGLLRHLMQLIKDSSCFDLQIIVTGMHLSRKFGETYTEILNDGFSIDRKVNLELVSDSPSGISKSIAFGLVGFAESFAELNPDLIIILGDRFEILSAVLPAVFERIPIAHIHGGELTEGVVDDAIRHAVTKFSHLHFVAHQDYMRRVIQLGESPFRVFNVGGLGVDAIKKIKFLSRSDLERKLGLKFLKKNLLITFHPVTLEKNMSIKYMDELFKALNKLDDTLLIFTMPNADPDSFIIYEMITKYVNNHPNAHAFTSLGQVKYLSCLRYIDGVIGNSSSGLIEVPSFQKGTINIGDRQKGRLLAASVINCNPSEADITRSINRLYSKEFQLLLTDVKNPYGNGGAAEKIFKILVNTDFSSLIRKNFYDLNFLCE